jgi:ATP-dependent Clp protease ATP-binding subunit ClpA
MTSNVKENSLKEFFRPEFLNRIDDIIHFDELSEELIIQIIDMLLLDVTKLLDEKNISVNYTE